MEDNMILITSPAEGVAQITINCPKTRNALSASVLDALAAAMDQVEADDSVRVVILTGIGKTFVAGADISYMSTLTAEQACRFSCHTNSVCERIRRSRAVYIAAINGYAFGAGCELSLASDISIAADTARFGLPEVGLGILPGAGGTQRLASLVGLQRAKEIIFTGDPIDSARAYEIGLVTRVTALDQLLPTALELARRILKNAPLAVKYAKECVQHSTESTLLPGISYENTRFGLCFASPDQKEGMSAFLEKRPPQFQKSF